MPRWLRPGESSSDVFLELQGSECRFCIDRTVGGGANEHESFSIVAMNELMQDAAAWVASRVMRQWKRSGIAPQRLQVRVIVEVDGDAEPEPPNPANN